MLNNTAKTGNFLVYIGNIYDVDKRFFVKVKKSKYIPLVIIAGLRQENTIRLCQSSTSLQTRLVAFFSQTMRKARCDFDYMA